MYVSESKEPYLLTTVLWFNYPPHYLQGLIEQKRTINNRNPPSPPQAALVLSFVLESGRSQKRGGGGGNMFICFYKDYLPGGS